ncbi:TetR/AcrR family transcriptional regulator [Tessaracoccus oleiagri]|uniref:Transcriptional regulator, TetR family n=1 Tax=Tessaracoccus oleiagri TaxID=686624 RepID=A0A1G9H9C4_9ACTN|nr:TetR/AcrR family transcriptional regulator [Tessaracoccus oleiagri]SDL09611.1 transcriptional regulator, TetR family [Tessaracoccus oleiagri]
MSETTPSREATKTRLIEAAIEEFGERGIDATSVEQLCERAGFTRGAFYSNFQTKDDLCIAVLEYNREQILQQLAVAFSAEPEGDLDWALNVALPGFFESLNPTMNARLTMLEIRLRATRVPELQQRLKDFESETKPKMEAILTELAESLGAHFSLALGDLISVAEAIYLHQLLEGDDDRLLKATVSALVTTGRA